MPTIPSNTTPRRRYHSRGGPGVTALTLAEVAGIKALVADLPVWWSIEKMKRECLRELSIEASHGGTVRRLISIEVTKVRHPTGEAVWASY